MKEVRRRRRRKEVRRRRRNEASQMPERAGSRREAKITKVGGSVGENHEGMRITGRGQPDAKKSPELPTSENLPPWHAKSIKNHCIY